jgi:predicted permease
MEGFVRLTHLPLGYDPHNVMSVGIPLQENSYTTWGARGAYYEQLRARVAEVPGVSMAAISTNATPPWNGWTQRFEILGKPAAEEQTASMNWVGPGYFPILHIPLLEGRVWTETENHDGAHVALINQTLARRYYPNGDAIGHSLKLPKLDDPSPEILSVPNIADSWLQIVGVVGDTRNDGLRKPIQPAVYVPYTLSMWRWTQILVRSKAPPLTLVHAVGAQVAAVNPEQPIYGNVEDLDTVISDVPEWQQEHLAAWIFSVLAWLALALAAVGLYSVVSYTVAQRTNEFGIRMALGAQRVHVMQIVFASTLGSVGIGILAGSVLTLSMNKILSQLGEGNLHHPILLLAGTLLLGFVSGVACAIPAWRAAGVDPMTALRCE